MTLAEFLRARLNDRLSTRMASERSSTSGPHEAEALSLVLSSLDLDIEMIEAMLPMAEPQQKLVARRWYWHKDYDPAWGRSGDPL